MSQHNDVAVGVGALALGGAFLAAFFIWGWQIYTYAKFGVWAPFSFTDLVFWLGASSWWQYPTSWVGIHKILDSFNAGFALLMIAMGVVFLTAAMSDS